MDKVRVRGRGNGVFTPKDFLDLGSRAAITSRRGFANDRALFRFVVSGQLRRIGRGFYDFPCQSKILKASAPLNLDATVKAISRRDQIQLMPNGIAVANALGLTNAVPARPSYISSGKTKTVQVGNRKVYLQHISQKAMAWTDRPGGQFVAAVLWLDKTIASAPDTIALMRAKLPDDVKQDLDLLHGWMASIARKVCSNLDVAV
jgi:Family of unknown function (DUF6088)